jgi:Holliday junction resolvase
MSKVYSKVDKNQPEIVKKLREYGCSVSHLHELKNMCDIVVGYKGKNYLFEIKSDYKSKLTTGEEKFFSTWTGQVDIIYCYEDAIKIIENEEIN